MAKVKEDLKDKVFGELKVIEYAGNSQWLCECSCGERCLKKTGHLTGGYVKTCGHKNGSNKLKDMKGMHFGKLEVIEYAGNSHWLCRCECKNEITVRGWDLRNNKKSSCGSCSSGSSALEDLKDKTFGYWHVNEYVGNKQWDCTCTLCNRHFNVYSANLKKGSKSCVECSGKLKIKNDYVKSNNIKTGTVDKYLGHSYYECTCGNCGAKVKRYSTSISETDTILCKHCSPLRLLKNMKDKTINNWHVLEYLGGQRWICECTLCGKQSEVFGYNLRSEHSTSCGCSLRKDLVNKHIGEWDVLEYVGDYKYLCRCSCNNEKLVHGYYLRNGESKSCGCKKWDNIKNTLLGRYGEIAPIKIKSSARTIEQINILNSKELLTEYIVSLGKKPSVAELERQLGVQASSILKHVHNYELENLVDINSRHSRQELDVLGILNNIFEDSEVILVDREVLNGKELDIYIPSKKLAFEINGTYWHSSIYKNDEYHKAKTMKCREKGIRLIHLFEYEWNNNEMHDKLVNHILNVCDDTNKAQIYARDCEVKRVNQSEYKIFCEKYHLQGYTQASIVYGLYRGNDLLQVMSFGEPRFSSECQYELIRLCVKDGYSVIGGSERLFKHFIDDYNPSSILSYCDIAKFTGNVYKRLGFKLERYTSPGYVWVNPSDDTCVTRYQAQKHKLVEKGLGTEDQTEVEIMESIGFLKVCNCGNAVYKWVK